MGKLTPWLENMLASLKHNKLTVKLVPAPEPKHPMHRIRVVESQNPEWYRELCARHPVVKRQDIERILCRLVAGKSTASKYADVLFELAILEREKQEEEDREAVPF
jgi:hypothetical protein